MFSIFLREVKSRWKSTLIWWISLISLVLILVWSYNSIEAIDYEQLLSQYPPEFSAFFGDIQAISTPAGFLGVEFFNAVYPLMLAIMAVIVGTGILAKEEDSGTLELLLASPMSRFSILTQKALAIVKLVFLTGSASYIGVVIGNLFFDFEISLIDPFWAMVSGALLGSVYGLFALMITSVTNKRGLSIGISTLFLVGGYFASTLPLIIEQLDKLKYFSLFYYASAEKILKGEIVWLNFIIIFLVGVIFYIFSYLFFKNRDIGT